MTATDTHLTTGWEPGLGADDTLTRRYLFHWAALCEAFAEAGGGRTVRTPALIASDCGSPAAYFNSATLLQPLAGAGDEALDAVEAFGDDVAGDPAPLELLAHARPLRPGLAARGPPAPARPPPGPPRRPPPRRRRSRSSRWSTRPTWPAGSGSPSRATRSPRPTPTGSARWRRRACSTTTPPGAVDRVDGGPPGQHQRPVHARTTWPAWPSASPTRGPGPRPLARPRRPPAGRRPRRVGGRRLQRHEPTPRRGASASCPSPASPSGPAPGPDPDPHHPPTRGDTMTTTDPPPTPTTTAAAPDGDVDAFVEKVFGAVLGAQEVQAAFIGDRLGWYDALAARPGHLRRAGPATATDERYAREWLEHQTGGRLPALPRPGGRPAGAPLRAARGPRRGAHRRRQPGVRATPGPVRRRRRPAPRRGGRGLPHRRRA